MPFNAEVNARVDASEAVEDNYHLKVRSINIKDENGTMTDVPNPPSDLFVYNLINGDAISNGMAKLIPSMKNLSASKDVVQKHSPIFIKKKHNIRFKYEVCTTCTIQLPVQNEVGQH